MFFWLLTDFVALFMTLCLSLFFQSCLTKFIRQINFNCSRRKWSSRKNSRRRARKWNSSSIKPSKQQICGCRSPYLSVAPFSSLSSALPLSLYPYLFHSLCMEEKGSTMSGSALVLGSCDQKINLTDTCFFYPQNTKSKTKFST